MFYGEKYVMEGDAEFVNVAIRIKPITKTENQFIKVISDEPPVLLLVDRPQTFVFDKIFTEEINQESIYNESVKPFVEYVKQGFNCTVFAYGQTGTGKTYTMGTDPNVKNDECFGLIPRALNHFFEYNNIDYYETEISLSFIEIYNEKVFDLLQSDNTQLQVKGFKAQGFSQVKVFNCYEAKHFLKIGNRNRHTAGTKQNPQSSRSHAIFTIYCKTKHNDRETSAKLNLVDLAGCERARKTGTYGSIFQEGVNINKGLLSIGQVMTALSSNASFIPYRQSIITSILQDSLNKQNFVSLIACISPLGEDATETIHTLEFAQRVKKFKIKPEVHEVISQYKKENPDLFQMRINTPFKRPISFQTPRPIKKAKPLLNISNTNSTDQSHSPKSISSVASSTCSTAYCPDVTQETLSPIIKKYLSVMEASIMDKIELIVNSTIKRPGREIIMKENCTDLEFGTPCLSWNRIQNEVSKIVKSEIAQLTSTKPVRATSSPIGESIRKMLNYDDSPLSAEKNKENNFKIPTIPPHKIHSNKRSTPELSPIENTTLAPRRSMRLSMKRISHNITTTLRDFEQSIDSFYFINEGDEGTHKENKENSKDCFKHGDKRLKTTNLQIEDGRNGSLRKREKQVLSVLDTPAGKRLVNGNKKDTPCTSHTKGALKTLNCGDIRKIQKLHTIGPKTAEQINLFRKLNGNMNKISDLKKMPGWGAKKFGKFVDENFLKKELI